MSKKILVISKDAGSSIQNNLLIPELKNLNFEIDCFSQSPGASFYSNQCANEVPEDQNYYEFFDHYFRNNNVSGVLVGFSSREDGIDEIACQVAKNLGIPTFAVQDYWGNQGKFKSNQIPDYIFLGNEIAYDLSVDFYEGISELVITGLPKYDGYRTIAKEKYIKQTHDGLNIGIFLQPLSIDAYLRSSEGILDSLSSLSSINRLFCKFHPATTKEESSSIQKKYPYFDIEKEPDNLVLFNKTDILVTVDSTCAIDFFEYAKFLNRPKLIISCQFSDHISDFLEDYSVNAMNSIAKIATSKYELVSAIEEFSNRPTIDEKIDILNAKSSITSISEFIDLTV